MLLNNFNKQSKKHNQGFTLIEVIISLGLLVMILLTVTTLAINYSRYQAKRLEKVQVQENFRNTIQIITQDLNNITLKDLLEPDMIDLQDPSKREMSFELFFALNTNPLKVVRYHIVTTGRESQVFRKVYLATGINWEDSWVGINRNKIINSEIIEDEPVSDRIKALSHLLFVYHNELNGIAIFMVGELVSKTKVSYVSLAYPRN